MEEMHRLRIIFTKRLGELNRRSVQVDTIEMDRLRSLKIKPLPQIAAGTACNIKHSQRLASGSPLGTQQRMKVIPPVSNGLWSCLCLQIAVPSSDGGIGTDTPAVNGINHLEIPVVPVRNFHHQALKRALKMSLGQVPPKVKNSIFRGSASFHVICQGIHPRRKISVFVGFWTMAGYYFVDKSSPFRRHAA